MKYYAERNGLLGKMDNIDLDDLKSYFYKIYRYFDNMDYFEAAIKGIWIKPQWGDEYQEIPPLMAPDPEIFFRNHLYHNQIYPIHEYYEYYTEEELFTVIEILYDKISKYDYSKNILEIEVVRKEFAIQINNILKFYNEGYFLEPNNGIITKDINEPLKTMLSDSTSEIFENSVLEQMRTAVKLYYRFDSNLETKKKAINILADVLEPLRNDLKNVLNEKFEANKGKHDKVIFGIVNNFNIRHNDPKQMTDYEHEIWYDWMMQYYTSVIITYYKLERIK